MKKIKAFYNDKANITMLLNAGSIDGNPYNLTPFVRVPLFLEPVDYKLCLDDLDTGIKCLENESERQREVIKQKEKEICELNHTIEERTAAALSEIQQKDKEICDLKIENEFLQESVCADAQEIKEKDAEIEHLKEELKSRDVEIHNLRTMPIKLNISGDFIK